MSTSEETSMPEDQESLDDVLMHFGVRGMKWGVRRADRAQSRATSARAKANAAAKPGKSNNAATRLHRENRADKLEDKARDAQALVKSKKTMRRTYNADYYTDKAKQARALAKGEQKTYLERRRAKKLAYNADYYERKAEKLAARQDKKFDRNANNPRTAIEVWNRAADLSNKNDISRINNKPQYKDQDFSRDTPLRRKYYAEHQKAMLDNLEKAAGEMGTNYSGTKKYGILEEDGGWRIIAKDIRHADEEIDFDGSFVNVLYDENGYIEDIDFDDDSLEHSDIIPGSLDDVLMHFGVRGMKWGVRRDRSGGSSSGPKQRGKIKRGLTKYNRALGAGVKVIDREESKLIFLPQNKRRQVAGETQRAMLGVAIGLNSNPKYRHKDIKNDPQLMKSYDRALEKAALQLYKENLAKARLEVAQELVQSYRDAKADSIQVAAPRHRLGDEEKVQHAADDLEVLMTLKLVRDSSGKVVDILLEDDDVAQGDLDSDNLDDILMHYGVRGMKWGVRRPVGSDGLVKSRAQNQADRAQGKADRAQAGADRRKGKPFNGAQQRNAKSLQKVANRKQKYATARSKLDKKSQENVRKLVNNVRGKTPAAKRKELNDKLSQLSTREIQEINNRVRATQEYRKLSAQEKLYNRSTPKRMTDWLLGLNQPPKQKNGSSLKDKIEAVKVANQIIDDVIKLKDSKGG